jgi:hypothetical protein
MKVVQKWQMRGLRQGSQMPFGIATVSSLAVFADTPSGIPTKTQTSSTSRSARVRAAVDQFEVHCSARAQRRSCCGASKPLVASCIGSSITVILLIYQSIKHLEQARSQVQEFK